MGSSDTDSISVFIAEWLDEVEKTASRASRFPYLLRTDAPWIRAAVRAKDKTASTFDRLVAMLPPSLILDDIEAKRRMLAEHQLYHLGVEPCCATCGSDDQAGGLTGQWPCLTLRLLALPIAGRPGYREEWRP